MRLKSMILLVIALGCGLIASIGISQVMESKSDDLPVETPLESIFVATSDIPLGQVLITDMLRQEEWPRDKIPEGAVQNVEEIDGKRTLTRLYPGEPILHAKLIDANKFSDASEKIPKGFRVASVKVTMDSSASGLINPGDRVDVLVFLKRGRGISLTGTRTILKNVTVFAVDDRFQRNPDEEETAVRAKTVSLLVKPDQVERLMLAQELGRIKLSLRRSDDDSSDNANGATLSDLDNDNSGGINGFSIAAAVGEPPQGSTGINDFLQTVTAAESDGDDTSEQAWVMHVHTPGSVQVYSWDDPKQLPRELLGSTMPADQPTTTTLPVQQTLELGTGELGVGDTSEVTPGESIPDTNWIDGDHAAGLLD